MKMRIQNLLKKEITLLTRKRLKHSAMVNILMRGGCYIMG